MADIYKSIAHQKLIGFGFEYTLASDEKNGFKVRIPKFKKEFEDCVNHIRRVSIGTENVKPTKTILLVGATGAGKSSLINSLVNKVFGIKYRDNFRIKIEEAECLNKTSAVSQTEWITVYEFNHVPCMTVDYNLTIIDTPGLNDTRGLNYDKLMFENLEMVLKINRFGVDELHCVGIVTQASANRLTDSQKYVYDGCMRLFGKDVKNIIHIMATFCDHSEPNIKDGLNAAEVDYVKIHEFNNGSIFLENNSENKRRSKINELNWDFMNEACGEFLNDLQSVEGQSLTQTRETLENRRKLHSKRKKVEMQFLENLNKAQNLQKSHNNVEYNQNSLKLSDIAPKRIQCSDMALNCSTCNVTCHKPCYGKDRCKLCKELLKERKCCTVCGCSHYGHHMAYFHFVSVFGETSQKTENDDMKEKIIRELIESLLELNKCVNTLKSVALRPIPMKIEEYVESLITAENEINDEATKEKIAILNCIKDEEHNMQSTLTSEEEILELIRRLDLSSKVEKGKKTGCKVM